MSSPGLHSLSDSAFLPDQARDYQLLTRRWKRLIKGLPFLHLRIFGEASGYPLLVVESKKGAKVSPEAPSLYVSAGIHGDEPAGVEGLFQWAAEFLPAMDEWNLQIFPCLNPWGLERNIRCDEEGRDLNRSFNKRKIPQISAHLASIRGRRYDLAIMLHEDYDARGFYLYEIAGQRPAWGEVLRDKLSPQMSPDPRRSIDGRAASHGVIRRRIDPALLKELKGHPEALHLHFHHARRIFTFETPSEDFLVRRVGIHKKFIELALTQLFQAKFPK